MKHIVKTSTIVITTNNCEVEIPKKEFYERILNEDILNDLTFEDLQLLWKDLYGFPANMPQILKRKIELYSSSKSINSFLYKGKEYWLDKYNRSCLWNISNSSLGNIELVVGDEVLNITPSKLKSFLVKLEDYAHKCFVCTFNHLQASKELYMPEDIFSYDYTTGYPEKIVLE